MQRQAARMEEWVGRCVGGDGEERLLFKDPMA